MQKFLTGGEQAENPWQSMSITSPGRCTLVDQNPRVKPYALKRTGYNGDIEGSYSVDKSAKYLNKPQFIQHIHFPESLPKPRTHTRNDPDRQLMINDIDGAQYSIGGGMERTKRCVNPLNPKYSLPSYKVPLDAYTSATLSPPRDILMTKDVNNDNFGRRGALNFGGGRDPLATANIDGAKADYNGYDSVRERLEQKLYAAASKRGITNYNLETNRASAELPFELTKKTFRDRTNRQCNVMQPVYHVNGIEIKDDPIKTKPKALPNFIPQGTYSLTTEDIPGATSYNSPKKKERRQIRNIMSTMDVPGAQADTVSHSITSDRVTCPLSPVYQRLDDGDALGPCIQPLMPKEMVKVGNLRPLGKSKSIALLETNPAVTPVLSAQSSGRGKNSSFFSPMKTVTSAHSVGSHKAATVILSPKGSARGSGPSHVASGVPALNFNSVISPKPSPRVVVRQHLSGGESVRASARERRQSSDRNDEINSVRGLPPTF